MNGAVLERRTCSFQTYLLRVYGWLWWWHENVRHQLRSEHKWYEPRAGLCNVDPCVSPNWAYSIPVTPCALVLFMRTINELVSDPREVVLMGMQERKITMTNSLQRNFSSFWKKCTNGQCNLLHCGLLPALQNTGASYRDDRINCSEMDSGRKVRSVTDLKPHRRTHVETWKYENSTPDFQRERSSPLALWQWQFQQDKWKCLL